MIFFQHLFLCVIGFLYSMFLFSCLFFSLLLGVIGFMSVSVCVCFSSSLCAYQIVGNGSEQQLQRELEDVLMDPSVADAGLRSEAAMDSLGGGDHGPLPTTASPVPPGADPLSAVPPPKLEMVLPVQTAQESELNERSYRGEPWCHFSYPLFLRLPNLTQWLLSSAYRCVSKSFRVKSQKHPGLLIIQHTQSLSASLDASLSS